MGGHLGKNHCPYAVFRGITFYCLPGFSSEGSVFRSNTSGFENHYFVWCQCSFSPASLPSHPSFEPLIEGVGICSCPIGDVLIV